MTGCVPAEWGPHQAIWLGFPSHPELWAGNLAAAREEVAGLARALAGPGGERVRLVAATAEARAAAASLVGALDGVESLEAAFGDIWLRDTGPIFTSAQAASAFAFNGWGGKYDLPGDRAVAETLAALAGARMTRHGFVLEGGALEHDGNGAAVTTRQCLLNRNRNSGWGEAGAAQALGEALGVRKIIWLDRGLMNDHTDGHVDNLARFVAPGVVACPVAFGEDDPNAMIYDRAASLLGQSSDVRGRQITVVRIPSPGRVLDAEGRVAPASHMNFIIANSAVIVPSYGGPSTRLACETLEMLFPDRRVIALSARALLSGGGAFHCISQQQPA